MGMNVFGNSYHGERRMSIRGKIDHADFQDRLSRSSGAVIALAEHFHCEKLKVVIPPVFISPTRAENPQYTDDGDLWIINDHQEELRVEVKWSGRDFINSWPYQLMWVMDSETWDKMETKPFAVFTVNKACTHAGVIDTDTFDEWSKKESYDKVRECVDLVYGCPVELVQWIKLKKCKR